ncbi:hypothetical protein D3C78_1082840 [compost metagenome]
MAHASDIALGTQRVFQQAGADRVRDFGEYDGQIPQRVVGIALVMVAGQGQGGGRAPGVDQVRLEGRDLLAQGRRVLVGVLHFDVAHGQAFPFQIALETGLGVLQRMRQHQRDGEWLGGRSDGLAGRDLGLGRAAQGQTQPQ